MNSNIQAKLIIVIIIIIMVLFLTLHECHFPVYSTKNEGIMRKK